VIGELHRRRAGAALAAIDDDEIRAQARLVHRLGQREPLPSVADGKLDAGRFAAAQLAQPVNECEQLKRGVEGAVRRRRDAINPRRHAPCSGDLRGDLWRRQNAPLAGFGALRELELDHLDLWLSGLRGKAFGVEVTVGGAAAEVARTDLPDQIATELAVVA